MYTQCPHCKTTFRIAEAHLKAAKGMVRCGSCQEIFDATKHLTSGMPGETTPVPASATPSAPKPVPPQPAAVKPVPPPPPPKPTPPPAVKPLPSEPPFRFDDPDEHEHIDLSVSVVRENMPDQTPFMDSIYDERSAYNNLDDIGPIHIPGELNFGDSIIKFVDDRKQIEEEIHIEAPVTEPPQHLRISDFEPEPVEDKDEDTQPRVALNIYEDVDSMEAPASDAERAAIDDLYNLADNQLHDDEQLTKNIEELLSYASALDDKPTGSRHNAKTEANELDDFEKELDSLALHNPLPFDHAEKPQAVTAEPIPAKTDDDDLDDFADLDINFDEDDEEPEEAISAQQPVPSASPVEAPEEFAADFNEPTIESKKESKPVTAATEVETEDELPSSEFDIPKALRASFANMTKPERPLGISIALGASIVVLLVGLFFQLVFFRSYELANSFPSISPLLTGICNSLPCRYSGSIDVSKIELMNRDVRSHPSQKNALLISTAFVNNAKFDQPYPTIAVKLSDLSGNIVATRHFKPEEYLESLYSKFLLMESGTPIHITLAVLDPGDDAINFEFSFLQ